MHPSWFQTLMGLTSYAWPFKKVRNSKFVFDLISYNKMLRRDFESDSTSSSDTNDHWWHEYWKSLASEIRRIRFLGLFFDFDKGTFFGWFVFRLRLLPWVIIALVFDMAWWFDWYNNSPPQTLNKTAQKSPLFRFFHFHAFKSIIF